ncbi:MAG: hypothetical protein ACE5IR_28060 [bacterium]
MQKLGKTDRILATYVGEDHRHLHETTTGFQFGTGDNSALVTDISQVHQFNEDVRLKVAHWLDQDGVRKAEKSKREAVIADEAAILPGTLDAKVRQLGNSFYAELMETIDRALENKNGHQPSSAPEGSEVLSGGGVLVNKPGGVREYIPEDALDDPLYDSTQVEANNPKISFMTKENPALAHQEGATDLNPDEVVDDEGGTFSDEIQKSSKRNVRSSKKGRGRGRK